MRGWELALATHAQGRFFIIQMFFFIQFINLAAQKTAKQRLRKYHPQRPLTTTPDL